MSLRPRLAGHEWVDQNIDTQCSLAKSSDYNPGGTDPVACRMTRSALFQVTEADIDKPGFAHVSSLTRTEYNDILSEKKIYDEHCEKIMAALRQVCG
jgi:hypothetical protein